MKIWLSIAKSLNVGYNKHVICPVCSAQGARPSCSINNNIGTWSMHCYKCKTTEIQDKGVLTLHEIQMQKEALARAKEPLHLSMPRTATPVFNTEGRAWLQDCGISASMARKYGLCFNEYTQGVILPCYNDRQQLTWLQERGVMPEAAKYRQPRSAKQGTWNNTLWGKSKVAVVVEDIASGVRISDATNDKVNAHALMGTSINDTQTVLLMHYDAVILWLDDDKAGDDARRAVRPVLSKFTTVKTIITKEDPKKHSNHEIQQHIISRLT